MVICPVLLNFSLIYVCSSVLQGGCALNGGRWLDDESALDAIGLEEAYAQVQAVGLYPASVQKINENKGFWIIFVYYPIPRLSNNTLTRS